MSNGTDPRPIEAAPMAMMLEQLLEAPPETALAEAGARAIVSRHRQASAEEEEEATPLARRRGRAG